MPFQLVATGPVEEWTTVTRRGAALLLRDIKLERDEACLSADDAFRRERSLKSGRGRHYLRHRIVGRLQRGHQVGTALANDASRAYRFTSSGPSHDRSPTGQRSPFVHRQLRRSLPPPRRQMNSWIGQRRFFPAAPWTAALKFTSAVGTLILAAVGYVAYRSIPAPAGFTRAFGLGIALVLPAIVIVSLLFMVTGYAVDGNSLYVQRPFWSSPVSLEGLSKIRQMPTACKGSLRIFGNAGLYSFTGLYQSRALGRYRLFATDFSRSVVLDSTRGVVVVTPAEPQLFIEHLRHLFPAARVELADGA